MELFTIQEDCLYAIKYPSEEYDEYNRIFEDHTDFVKVLDFFETYKWEIDNFYIKELDIPSSETETFANTLIQEALQLEEYFEDLIDNTLKAETPNLFGHFKTLEGFEKEDTPAMKSYGLGNPSMLRVYAIEVDNSCMIIFYSGIKIRLSLRECPVLREKVLQKARNVIAFLKENDAIHLEGVKKLAKE